MDFFSQTFQFTTYYYMVKIVFDIIGYDYYKGLKNKLPPIRYIGIDNFDNEYISLAHPKDFLKYINLFKNAYKKTIKNIDNNTFKNIKISDVHNEILEIYPATQKLYNNPNGFTALFVNNTGMNIVNNEFNENDEVANINFIPVDENGINTSNIKLCGVINKFVKKFNNNNLLIEKYKNTYLVVGEMKDINIISGESIRTNKFNIIGGKRTYTENSIESAIRETSEELGLIHDSKLLKLINILLPKTKDIIKCVSFNVFCIYLTPKTQLKYNYLIKNYIQNQI